MRLARTLALAILLAPSVASAYPTVRSFTPSSVVLPILAVQLRAEDGQVQPIHVCSGALPEDCLVDIADDAALASLFTGVTTIDAGTYTALSVVTCGGASGQFDLRLQGAADFGEAVWYTSRDLDVVTTDPSRLGYVATQISGCTLEVPFPEPMRVAPGDDVDLSAFVALDNLAWVGLGEGAMQPGCAFDPVRGSRVCVAYPHLIPVVGSTPPTLRRYHITEDVAGDPYAKKAQGQLLVLFDDAGIPVGGLSRPLFLPDTVDGHVRYDTPLKRIDANGDGTYMMLNYGSSSDPKDMTNYGVKFPEFAVQTHAKQMIDVGGHAVDYLAVSQ